MVVGAHEGCVPGGTRSSRVCGKGRGQIGRENGEMRSATTYQEDVAAEWSEPARDEPSEQAAPSAEDLDSVEVEATASSSSSSAAEPLVGDLDVLGRFYA